jgi:dTDP-4-dehydrorhamnose reductase
MRVLITGAAGMLGRDLVGGATAAGHEPVALARADLDITDAGAVGAAVSEASPDVVINCAAWTNVDLAERSAPAASAVNGAGAGHVAGAAAAAGAWTIQVSSDYVFSGEKREPYLESDPVGPASAYGRTKLEGELAVTRAAPERHTIIRSSWLFGIGGPCFPATILRLAEEREELTVVDDQIGCPTFTGHLAEALLELAGEPAPGIFHVAAAGECSWYEFAGEIVSAAGLDCVVRPGSTADLARPAPRPAYSVMRTERGPDVPRLAHWREGLSQYISARVPR